MTQQALAGCESLGHHVRVSSKTNVSDSASTQRRASLPWPFFEQLFARVLKPLAQHRSHADAFFEGFRLLGVDGSQYSLRNSPAVLQMQRARPRNQFVKASAFMKWSTAVLLELGTHQPLGVACAQAGLKREEGELDIARRTLSGLPQQEPCLLLADRLYGSASFILDVQEASAQATQLLVRMRSNVRGKLREVLADGSALIAAHSEVRARAGKPSAVLVREIRVSIQSPGKKAEVMRLWTTLLDAKKYPAQMLAALYAKRWEQELFFRELKGHVAGASMLKAGSEETAQAEFAGLILAASLVAQQRIKTATVASEHTPLLRYSLAKIGRMLYAMEFAMRSVGAELTEKQRERVIKRWLELIERETKIPPRRQRRCQRGLRKTRSHWPPVKKRSFIDPNVVLAPFPYV